MASGDIVFSFGGIGATPADHTRQCAAEAAGVDLALHPDAEAAIRSRTDMVITPQRLKMGELPVGSRIIPNSYNKIPGFSMGDHHFVPGFPVMAWPMVEWVLDQRYAHLEALRRNHHVGARADRRLRVGVQRQVHARRFRGALAGMIVGC